MWPWEHAVVAYVLYSALSHALARAPPSTRETVAVLVGSQLPDLVDKPLAWTFGITETGYSIGHSMFVAPVVCLAVYVVAVRNGDRRLADAFSLAYLSHLVTDVLNPIRSGRPPELRVVLWPVSSPPTGDHGGFIDHFGVYFVRYMNAILADGLSTGIALQFLLGTAVLALWLYDGAPIASDCWRLLRDRFR
ncbi:metal-dependent hydrolase [Natrialbaceae archaeon A-arb3/5]